MEQSERGCHPEFRMGDGAPAITKAGEELFADYDQCEDSLRLMCWSHVHHAVNKSSQFKHLRSVDNKLAEVLLADIETIFYHCLLSSPWCHHGPHLLNDN